MAVLEVIVSLLCTYASSEYLHGSKRRALWAGLAAVCFALMPVIATAASELLAPVLHLRFKVPLVAVCYIGTLYVDVVVYQKKLGGIEFVREVLDAAVALLPLFPFFSIGIAFIFLEVGELFEHYHIPTESLNQPIYYGVLYGPFAYVYVRVKRVAKVSTILPRSV